MAEKIDNSSGGLEEMNDFRNRVSLPRLSLIAGGLLLSAVAVSKIEEIAGSTPESAALSSGTEERFSSLDMKARVRRAIFQNLDSAGMPSDCRTFREELTCEPVFSDGLSITASAEHSDCGIYNHFDGVVDDVSTAVVVDRGNKTSIYNEWDGAPILSVDLNDPAVQDWFSLVDAGWVYDECNRLADEYDVDI